MKSKGIQIKYLFKLTLNTGIILLLLGMVSCARNYTCSCKGPDNAELNTVFKSDSWEKANDLCSKQKNPNDTSNCVILESQRKCY